MTDLRSQGGHDDDLPLPPKPQRDRAESLSRQDLPNPPPLEKSTTDEKQAVQRADGLALQGPLPQPGHARPSLDPTLAKQVNDVLASELGIPTLLNRLKQSIVSAKEFALFLKKRSVLEDDYAQGLRKLCRLTQESARRPEHRQGTFSQSYDEMIFIHDRMAENGLQFAASLHQMNEDLAELAAMAERGRKSWKATGMAAEQKVADLEQAMRKSKTKYDSLAEEYDRTRTGEAKQSGKVLGAFKAHKSAAQQEEDLLRKAQAAEQAYQGHVHSLQTEKAHLLSLARPEAVKALQELIMETDSGVALQMQKFAAFNERLLLGNGMIVSPFKNQGADGASQPRSLRQAVAAIDNPRDLNEFVASHHARILPSAGEVKFERNPLLNPQHAPLNQPTLPPSLHPPQSAGHTAAGSNGNYSPQLPPTGGRSSFGNSLGQAGASQPPQGSMPSMSPASMPIHGGPQDPSRSFQQQHNRSVSQGVLLNRPSSPQSQSHYASMGAGQSSSRFGHDGAAASQGPPQLGALSFQSPQASMQQLSSSPQPSGSPFQAPQQDRRGSAPGSGAGAVPAAYGTSGLGLAPAVQNVVSTPLKPVFGVPLGRLYERDGLAVPLVVYQCIQAVDLFGLGLEGIYRQSGSLSHINKLKGLFDAESQGPSLDFRNPENFFHDVNSVTGLLKQFFRDLPDPLLMMEHHDAFIAAAKKEDDIVRRDSLHAIINSLPDPNYATLRALALHLYRVMDNSHVNRMNSHNLAVIFGPTLMGSDPGTAIADAGWQIKVIDTILQNTYQIFDDD